jgi:hypothetical protein
LQAGTDAQFAADDTLYRLLEDDPSTALNAGEISPCAPMLINELGETIH